MYNSEFARFRSRMNNLFNEFDAAMGFGGGHHPFWGGASRAPGFGRGLFDDPFFDDDFRALTAPPASAPTSTSTANPSTTTTSSAGADNKPGSSLTTDAKHSAGSGASAAGSGSGSGSGGSHEVAVAASPHHGLGLGLGLGLWGGAPSAPWLKQMKPISVDVVEVRVRVVMCCCLDVA
jgi:hypothetical protein